ncbi:MAG: hypothetical protein M3O15_05705 [Acidobacteriota bacterium]|nr:hypothetical protein [Acidobacteriota bacterium]
MSTTFQLYFTGLCGIVPRTAGGYRIVLVNAQGMNPPHVASVLVQASEYDAATSTRKPDGKPFFGDPTYFGPNQILSFSLNDEDLTIDSVGENIPSQAAASPGAPCPHAADWQSLDWVAQMNMLGAGTISDRHFDGRHPNEVLARIDIPQNIDLVTSGFSRDAKKNVATFAFTDSNGKQAGRRQALANSVAIAMSVASAQNASPVVKLNSTNGKTIVLSPHLGLVRAWIVNVPQDELVNAGQPMSPGDTNDHFHMFYNMATMSNAMFLPRLIDGSCNRAAAGGASSPKCPPVMFDPHP